MSKEKWKMSELISMCVQEEERIKFEQLDGTHVATIGPSKGKKFGICSVQGNKNASITKTNKASSSGTNGPSGPKCHFCRAKGHMRKECQKFREWVAKKEQVPTSGNEVGTSNPQPPQPSTSEPFPPSSSQPSQSLPAKNALGYVKDQAEDKASPKAWFTTDEKSNKMSIEELTKLIREYPILKGWYARVPNLQEPANYGTKFETGIYEEQVKSGYRLPLHPFVLNFFEHYHMAPGQLVLNGWRNLVGLIYLVETSGYKADSTDFMRVFFKIYFVKGVANCPGWYYIHSRQRLLKDGLKSNKGWHSRYFFVGHEDKKNLSFDKDWNPYCKDLENPGKPTPNDLTKHILIHMKLRGGRSIDEPLTENGQWKQEITSMRARGKRKEKQPSVKLPLTPKKAKVTPPNQSPWVVEGVSINEDPIFCPRWTIKCDDMGMPDSHISEQYLLHGILPRDKEFFQNQTHKSFACSFAQAICTMYVSGSTMFSRFEIAREELSKRETDYLAHIEALERRLEQAKKRLTEESKKVAEARDQGIREFLDGNTGEEWLKK
ncbi:hypothetical protein RJ639_008056 [Escallonia herrerae]|uniref:Transposase (putative) gypsy type domain-containing protein n=1 Tax=Escallonia herrerae TaxID=1293975 RepID=A0AA88VU84_9ASTE|nr:hypothetical protein RJ639_008056 [Escallonia herrerae]